jgi:hypothetical protein
MCLWIWCNRGDFMAAFKPWVAKDRQEHGGGFDAAGEVIHCARCHW